MMGWAVNAARGVGLLRRRTRTAGAQWHRPSNPRVAQWTTLRTLVELLTELGEDRVAAALLGAIEVAQTAAPAFRADAQRVEEVTSRLRWSLGDDGFAAQFQLARELGDDRAVALAAETLGRLTRRSGLA